MRGDDAMASEWKVVRVTSMGKRYEIGIHGTRESCEIYCDVKDWEWLLPNGMVNGLNVVPESTPCEKGR